MERQGQGVAELEVGGVAAAVGENQLANAGLQPVDPATPVTPRQKRKKRRHHTNHLLPTRPKKPSTGYGLFLREYFQENHDGQPRQTLKTASAQWHALTDIQRQDFNARLTEERAKYNRELQAWKSYRNALKKPATAYGLFLKDTWERERNTGRTVAGMGRYAADLWANLPEMDREQYHTRRQDLMARYHTEMTRVREGEPLNMNWMQQAVNELNGNAARGQNAEAQQDGEEESDEEVDEGDENLLERMPA